MNIKYKQNLLILYISLCSVIAIFSPAVKSLNGNVLVIKIVILIASLLCIWLIVRYHAVSFETAVFYFPIMFILKINNIMFNFSFADFLLPLLLIETYAAVCNQKIAKYDRAFRKATVYIFVLVCLSITSILFNVGFKNASVTASVSFGIKVIICSLYAWVFIFYFLKDTDKKMSRVIDIFIISVTFISLLSVLTHVFIYLDISYPVFWDWTVGFRVTAIYQDPNYCAFFLAMGMPPILYKIIKTKKKIYYTAAILMSIAISSTASRGGSVGLIMPVLIAVAYLISKKRWILSKQIINPVIICLLACCVFAVTNYTFQREVKRFFFIDYVENIILAKTSNETSDTVAKTSTVSTAAVENVVADTSYTTMKINDEIFVEKIESSDLSNGRLDKWNNFIRYWLKGNILFGIGHSSEMYGTHSTYLYILCYEGILFFLYIIAGCFFAYKKVFRILKYNLAAGICWNMFFISMLCCNLFLDMPTFRPLWAVFASGYIYGETYIRGGHERTKKIKQ